MGRGLALYTGPSGSGKRAPSFQVMVNRIPLNTTQRHLRKSIGHATNIIRNKPQVLFQVKLNRKRKGKPFLSATLTFYEPYDNVSWIQLFGGDDPQNEVKLDGCQLQFSRGPEIMAEFLPSITGKKADGDEANSDYDDDDAKQCALDIIKVECGAFNAEDQFCIGWSKDTTNTKSQVTFDIDDTLLSIRMGDEVIESPLRHIAWIYEAPKRTHLYIGFRYTPIFWQERLPEEVTQSQVRMQLLDMIPGTQDACLDRVYAFDVDHEACAQFAMVYRVQVRKHQDVARFFKNSKGRLHVDGTFHTNKEAGASAFTTRQMHNSLRKLDFKLAFQVQALMRPHKFLPIDVSALCLSLQALQERWGADIIADKVSELRARLIERGPHSRKLERTATTVASFLKLLRASILIPSNYSHDFKQGILPIRTVLLTPCGGTQLEGPHSDQTNSILRQYPGHEGNFIRVRISEEDASVLRIRETENRSWDRLLSVDYAVVMKADIEVAGRQFAYLGSSNSGLHDGSCWFVSEFQFEGQTITAQSIRDGIGALDCIRQPSLYAARLGQAFTSTSVSIKVSLGQVHIKKDVFPSGKFKKQAFTDGIGGLSQKLATSICEKLKRSNAANTDITAFQIRLGGAKGVLAVDHRLKGEQIDLHLSMIKFEFAGRSQYQELGIVKHYPRPSDMVLNRPMIALLETLGVPVETFLKFQQDAINNLSGATLRTNNASKVYRTHHLGKIPKMNVIMKLLAGLNMNPLIHIPFLHDANISALQYILRSIKYQCRIRVPYCYTLLGIVDETGFLEPGEVAVNVTFPGSKPRFLTGTCLVGRSPLMAPGDIQRVQAKMPSEDHPIYAHRNVIVFPKKGTRPIPNMLSGGDLDGDTYHVIQHPKLLQIQRTYKPADYPSCEPLELDRDCTAEDLIDYFLQYVKKQNVGIIATHHLILADQRPLGLRDPECKELARLHSTAVDFAKTGVPANVSRMPKLLSQRPDFMQKEHHLEILHSDADSKKKQPRKADLFYESQKALGHLFRAVDTYTQTEEWKQESTHFHTTFKGPDGIFRPWDQHLFEYLVAQNRASNWRQHLVSAQQDVLDYYTSLTSIQQDNCHEDKTFPLTEEEVFMGHIFSRRLDANAKPYDSSMRLQEDFENLCTRMRRRTLHERSLETSLSRSVWNWLNRDVHHELQVHEAQQAVDKAVEQGDYADPPSAMQGLVRQLLYAIAHGAAWVHAAFLLKDKRGSAEWIVVPSILRAHQCLDVIEQLLRSGRE